MQALWEIAFCVAGFVQYQILGHTPVETMPHFISLHLTSACAADRFLKSPHYVISSDFIDCLLMCVTNSKFEKPGAGEPANTAQEI